ncbi:hypothetical protein E4633_20285 [Geomonas terrae]|uniref:DUF4760 domain-containing protein n=1 Tax=Geomonas terrae TaxID=2562681 RepID=A0A4S1C9L4_9BACT|nr:hypothetical protein E4633_20285 [Geomonas terrae]
MDLDYTSLLAGISITAVAGWIGSFFGLRKDERTVQMEQVTKERTKWRENIRKLTEEIVATYLGHTPTKPQAEKIATCRSRLATSLNPKDHSDNELLEHFDMLFKGERTDITLFTHRIALLLKHDWERVKWECTPIYIKPFLVFSKNQRLRRRSDYREIGPKI